MPTITQFPHPNHQTLRHAVEAADVVEITEDVDLGTRLVLNGVSGKTIKAAAGVSFPKVHTGENAIGTLLMNGNVHGILLEGLNISSAYDNPGGSENGVIGVFPTGTTGPVTNVVLRDLSVLGGPSSAAGVQMNSVGGQVPYTGIVIENVSVEPSTAVPLGAYSRIGPSCITFFEPGVDDYTIDIDGVTTTLSNVALVDPGERAAIVFADVSGAVPADCYEELEHDGVWAYTLLADGGWTAA